MATRRMQGIVIFIVFVFVIVFVFPLTSSFHLSGHAFLSLWCLIARFYLLSERLHGKKEDARLRGSDVDKLLVVAILIPEQDIDQLIS